MTRRDAAVAPRESATGAIYDLGYRGYDGPRLGRRSAFATLFWASLRAAFGLGRSGRSKLVPWGLTAIMIVPAAVAGAIQALAPGGLSPFNYNNYLWDLQPILALFVAAQSPELVSSDQRNHVLSLYFSHALARSDYALAKFGAMAAALFILELAPLLVILFASILASSDVAGAVGDQLGNLPQIVGSPLIYAIPLAGLGMAIASFTPRRAYATGAIIAIEREVRLEHREVLPARSVLGGIGQPYGAMLGGLIVGVSSEVAAAVSNPNYKDVVAFVILIAFLLVRPRGLFGAAWSTRRLMEG